MFCYHCQEAKKNIACDTAGICGKKADVSSLHDLLTYALKGLSFYSVKATELEISEPNIDKFTARAWYSMVTNVNFDAAVFVQLISETVQRREHIKHLVLAKGGELNRRPHLRPRSSSSSFVTVVELFCMRGKRRC